MTSKHENKVTLKMENEYSLDISTETISPPSLPKDHSPSNFSATSLVTLKFLSKGQKPRNPE